MPENKLQLFLAGMVLEIKYPDSARLDLYKKAHQNYLVCGKEPDIKLDIHLRAKKSPRGVKKIFSGPYDLYQRPSKTSEFEAYAKKEYVPLGDLLRFITGGQLLGRRGLLLHSCGLIMDKNAFLFVGPSGSGKTTLARLAQKRFQILSDETVAVTKNGRGYQAWATPFFGDFGKFSQNIKSRLNAMFFLRKSRRFYHHKLDSKTAALNILKNVFIIGGVRSYNVSRALDIAADIARNIDCYELEFLPEESLWRYLKEKIYPGA